MERTAGCGGGGVGQGLLTDIAGRVGTPVYVYDAAIIRERYRRLTDALRDVPHRIHYAVKANGNLSVLAVLRSLGAGADIGSAGELARALAARFPPSDIVFSGAGKTRAELRAALQAGAGVVNVEAGDEVTALAELTAGEGVRASVALRVNPDIAVETHPYTRTGELGMKFGVPCEEVPSLARAVAAAPSLELIGLAAHVGSQVLDPAPFRRVAELLVGLGRALRDDGHDRLQVLDVGGGLGIGYAAGEADLDAGRYAAAVGEPIHRAGFRLVVEPGRYLVGPAGVLLTRALYCKRSGARRFVIADAGMTDLLRPSHYDAYHDVTVIAEDAGRRPIEIVDIVGPACESGDFLALDRALPAVSPGDLLAIHDAGAYGFVMASNYNARLRPAEVLVDGGRWAVVRERETPAALLLGETAAVQAWREAVV